VKHGSEKKEFVSYCEVESLTEREQQQHQDSPADRSRKKVRNGILVTTKKREAAFVLVKYLTSL
jgi:hypothetical protein